MASEDTKRIYPTTPLEAVVTHEQKQKLLTPPAPPSYEQSINASPAHNTEAPHVVVVTQPTPVPYGPHPVDITCPFCHNETRTRLRNKPSSKTHLIAALLCLFQLYCCICLPYFIKSCLNTQHYCGMCDRYLGTYVRS